MINMLEIPCMVKVKTPAEMLSIISSIPNCSIVGIKALRTGYKVRIMLNKRYDSLELQRELHKLRCGAFHIFVQYDNSKSSKEKEEFVYKVVIK